MILRFGLISAETQQASPGRVLDQMQVVTALGPLQIEPREGCLVPHRIPGPARDSGRSESVEWRGTHLCSLKIVLRRNHCVLEISISATLLSSSGRRWAVAASAAGSVLWRRCTLNVPSCLLQVLLDLTNERILSCCAPRKLFSKTFDTPVKI